jgi:hypothetical protein
MIDLGLGLEKPQTEAMEMTEQGKTAKNDRWLTLLSLLAVGYIGWQQVAYQKIQADMLNRLERVDRFRGEFLGKQMPEAQGKPDVKLSQ